MKKLTRQEENQVRWHLLNNVMPGLTHQAMDGIINNLNEVRTSVKGIDDVVVPDSDVTIGEMVEDLKLEDFIPHI